MGDHDRSVVWRISGHDLQVHAFYDIGGVTAEALCEHSVPSDRLVDPDESDLHPRRCIACLLMHGGDLADHRGDPGGWARDMGE